MKSSVSICLSQFWQKLLPMPIRMDAHWKILLPLWSNLRRQTLSYLPAFDSRELAAAFSLCVEDLVKAMLNTMLKETVRKHRCRCHRTLLTVIDQKGFHFFPHLHIIASIMSNTHLGLVSTRLITHREQCEARVTSSIEQQSSLHHFLQMPRYLCFIRAAPISFNGVPHGPKGLAPILTAAEK